MRLFNLLLEAFPAEVGESDQEVHENTDLHPFWWLLDHLQNALDYPHHHLRFFSKSLLAPPGVDHIRQHGCGKIKAEHMDLRVEAFLDEV